MRGCDCRRISVRSENSQFGFAEQRQDYAGAFSHPRPSGRLQGVIAELDTVTHRTGPKAAPYGLLPTI